MVGGAETMEYFRQTDLLIENWSDLLSTIDRHVEPDVGHIDLIDRLASSHGQMFERIINWLK
jgi:hypothetical protein